MLLNFISENLRPSNTEISKLDCLSNVIDRENGLSSSDKKRKRVLMSGDFHATKNFSHIDLTKLSDLMSSTVYAILPPRIQFRYLHEEQNISSAEKGGPTVVM